MRFEGLILLAIGTVVSGITINLPLKSLSADQDGQGLRGVTKYRQENSTGNGVNVPVTDWFNRTDNQVKFIRHARMSFP